MHDDDDQRRRQTASARHGQAPAQTRYSACVEQAPRHESTCVNEVLVSVHETWPVNIRPGETCRGVSTQLCLVSRLCQKCK